MFDNSKCVVYTTHNMEFDDYIRKQREALRADDRNFSLRKVAKSLGVEPSYLSKIERGEQPPPSEATIGALAEILGEDKDTLLALGGKVSTDLKEVIMRRPSLFASLIRELKDLPDHAVLRIVREIRDGDW